MNLSVRAFAASTSLPPGFALVLIFTAFLFAHRSFAQTQVFNSSGTFTVPAGVTSITVQAWGAGGGGGNGGGKEGGGGGGAYAGSTFSVTAGNTHTITVGAGGAEGTGGAASSFDATVIALGGSSGSGDNGFAGGSGPSSTGTTKFSGGNGGGTSGGTSGGGGGGGSATSSANGGDGTNGTGTNPGAGGTGTGAGGDGGDDDGNPAPEDGFAPGGGGGGSSSNNTSSGSGADGRVTITWTCSDNITNMGATATTPVCTGNTSTVTVTSTTLAGGTFTVYYNLSGANTATAQSASMVFNGGTNTGTFSTIALANSGATTITITSVGCANVVAGQDFTATVTVNGAPATPGAITGTASVCPSTAGLAYSISAVSGATSYTWTVPTGWSITAGQGTVAITVTSGSAGQSGNITVTATNTCGTSAASTLAVSTVQDIGFNNSITTDALSICVGTTGTTIDGGNPSGGQTYTWQVSTTGAGGPFATVSPDPGDQQDWTISNTYYNSPGTYYFRRVISSSSCNGNGDVVTLTVNANPTTNIAVTETSGTANDGTVCNGTLATLGVASASSYLWAPGGATTQTIDVTPASTTTYTVTVTNAAGCTATDTQIITVNAVPTINSISATPSTICLGQSSTLAVTVPNNSTQTFTSSGGSVTINDNANATPFPKSISVSGLPASGITVATVTLTGLTEDEPQDMDFYLEGPNGQSIWLTSDAGGSATITSYTLNFQDGGTAISTSAFTNGGTYAPGNLGGGDAVPPGTVITALSGFTGNQNGTWNLYLIDDSSTGSGGSLSSWSITFNVPNYTFAWPNSATTASTSVTPAMTTTYTVTVTANGCSSTASTTVTVNTSLTAAIAETDASCTADDMKVLSGDEATLTASGGVSYLWDGGSTSAARVVNPLVTTTYTVTVTDGNGCTDTETKQIEVVTPPMAAIGETDASCAANDMKVLSGDAATLMASGGVSYLWDGGSTSAARVVNPLVSTTYTVQVTDGNGCTDTETATVTVNPLPTAVISGVLSFCTGGNTILTASGGTSYLWNDLSTNDMLTVNAAGAYTVQVTDDNGCTDTETATVTAGTPASADAGGPYTTCGATPVAIAATASGAGMWSGGSGAFANATNTNTTYTPAMAEFGTTVTLTWTTDDPDGAGGCPAVSDNANLAVSGQNIEAKGNGMVIPNGDASPAAADHTDFGWTTVSSGTITKTFTILNSGTSSLTLTGGTPVTLSGSSDFTVTMQPTSPVPSGGGMTMFQIQFDPSSAGMHNATVSIASNDCDVPNYTFDITGKGAVPQAISVFGNGNQITNRASTASVSDDTDFGSTGGMVSHTFTINNIANGSPLSLTGVPKVTIADRDASDFTVTASPASPIDGGSSTTFTIKFQPGATGLRTAIVIITHNDLPENPFIFTINGTGL